MTRKKFINLIVFGLCALNLSCQTGSSFAEAFATPTPDQNGQIIYTASANDNCLSVSLKMGITIDQLKSLNELDEECVIESGQKLLIGTYSTPVPTIGPTPEPTLALPTPTLYLGSARICAFLFNDENVNSLAGSEETGIDGGAVTVTQTDGSEVYTGLTADGEMLCFDKVPEGEYHTHVVIPDNFIATTNMDLDVSVNIGDTKIINFGAYAEPVTEPADEEPDIVSEADPGIFSSFKESAISFIEKIPLSKIQISESLIMPAFGLFLMILGVLVIVIYQKIEHKKNDCSFEKYMKSSKRTGK